jgi:hypothetical protein
MKMTLVVLLFFASQAFAVAPKEVWTYKNRPQEPNATLTILKLESIKGVNVIHVRLDGLKIKNKLSKTGYSEWVADAPFEEKALKKSLVKKIRTVKRLPAYVDEYKKWRKLKGPPILKVSVKEAIDAMEKAASKASK